MEARLTDIPIDEVLRYMGHGGQTIDCKLDEQISGCIRIVSETSKPRLTYTVVDVHNGTIDGLYLRGNDIKNLLIPCSQAIVMAATLGSEADAVLRRTEVLNMADALIMDSAQSVAIENVCDNFEAQMRTAYREKGQYLTDRFSPGYGDLPLDCQKIIISVLSADKRIGLTVTPGNILVPRKSVTCIIGISDRRQTLERRSCASCTLRRNCTYGKGGSCRD